jgi:hypothetical protein
VTHYSRQNAKQAAEVDAVYAAMQQFPEGQPIPSGNLTKSTGLGLTSVIAALELLVFEGKAELVLKDEYKTVA